MSALLMVLLTVTAVGCGGRGAGPSTTTTTAPATTTTTTPTTTLPAECPEPPYAVEVLPERVSGEPVAADDVPTDEFTSIPGSRSTLWTDSEGDLVVALIRGTLPPREYPGERGAVEVAGLRAVAGQFEDGSWVVAWYEEPGERCNLYTMVFYPPVTPQEVEASLASVRRLPRG